MENLNEDVPVPPKGLEDVAAVLARAEAALDSGVRRADFEPLDAGGNPAAAATVGNPAAAATGGSPASAGADGRTNLDLLLDVSLPVSVEVGRTQMSLSSVLDLVPGSVIGLDKRAEEPVDLRVNGKLVARGEAVLIDDQYGIRITEIVGPLPVGTKVP